MILSFNFSAFNPRKSPNLRAVYKALSWRAVGALDTLAISFFVTGSLAMASSIMGIEVMTKVALYWLHDRAWDKAAPLPEAA